MSKQRPSAQPSQPALPFPLADGAATHRGGDKGKGIDRRGNNRDRARRRAWLLSKEAGFGGDGASVPCSWCATPVTDSTLEVDRHPIPGHLGGSYRRGNIVPACAKCNGTRHATAATRAA